jgi:segregation and condensation protein A
MRVSSLQLDLDCFDGPFDLLCTMLLRRELGVDEVPLAEVVVSYVAQLAEQSRVDPDTAGEFLVLVAALMEVKTRELLNVEDDLEIPLPEGIEAHEDMLERLVRYHTMRNASRWLAGQGGRERWWREASPAPRRRPGRYDGPQLDAARLQRSMDVLLASPDVDVRHLVGRHASVHEMTGRLLGMLRERRTVQLDDALKGMTRLDQAVTFVAALELCKAGDVELIQEDRFGPITVAVREAQAAGGTEPQTAAAEQAAVDAMGAQTA